MEKFVPNQYKKSIFSIDYETLKISGIKCILFDLDNTIATTKEKIPSNEVIELINKLKQDFKIIIFSNATKKRLMPFKSNLDVDCFYSSKKPRKKNFLKVLKLFNYDISEVIIIGDQLLTDIYGGNKIGITTVLVNPLKKIDISTIFNRIIEKIIMIILKKKDLFVKGRYYE